MKKVLFYITGHGFGHAIRTIEIINQLGARAPQLQPIISSTAPEWLVRREVNGRFEYVHCENDVGAIQRDWRTVEKAKTLRRYAERMQTEVEFVKAQTTFVQQQGVGMIVADIPAVAFAVAKQAGIPSIAISNFSWDFIYAPYLEEYPNYRFVVEHIRECYSYAGRLLRLPFCGDLSAFPIIEDIPLVARRSTKEREEVLHKLGLDPGRMIVLIYLGRFDHQQQILSDEMRARKDLLFITFDVLGNNSILPQDLVGAADVVVTKPGYGIVSDCIANRTPILYTERQDFAEYDALVAGIRDCASNRFLPEHELLSRQWLAPLDDILTAEYAWPEMAANGGDVAAEKILAGL